MSNEVWVWAEQRNGQLMGVSLEILNTGSQLAQKLGREVVAVLIGYQISGLAAELVAYGANKVYTIDKPELSLYQSDVYAKILADLVQKDEPTILLLGATNVGMDLAPRVAAKLKTGLTAHCADLRIDDVGGKPLLVADVPGFGGNMVVSIACPERRPQMATVRPGVMERPSKESTRKGAIIPVEIEIRDKDFRARTVEIVEQKPEGAPLEAAEIVVAGGWGLKSVGGFKFIEELASVLGGSVAGTRPAVDANWVTEDRMIGSSGKTVAPKLFISVGASGATHFTTGFLKSKTILAVDQNPKAPIFEVCDIGICGDVAKVVPCLIGEIKKIKAG